MKDPQIVQCVSLFLAVLALILGILFAWMTAPSDSGFKRAMSWFGVALGVLIVSVGLPFLISWALGDFDPPSEAAKLRHKIYMEELQRDLEKVQAERAALTNKYHEP